MRTDRRQRGTTLLEAMIAMGVLMIGAAGLVGLQRQSNFFMGDSRRTTRACTSWLRPPASSSARSRTPSGCFATRCGSIPATARRAVT